MFNAESVGLRLANAFSVVLDVFVLTQGCANPGLKLANAFGVQDRGLKLANAFGVQDRGGWNWLTPSA
jgi:predicted outer membrane lipoprotein